MLPIATPPNAVVFGSGKISIKDMIKAGFLLNIISVVVVTIISIIFIKLVFDAQIGELPNWV